MAGPWRQAGCTFALGEQSLLFPGHQGAPVENKVLGALLRRRNMHAVSSLISSKVNVLQFHEPMTQRGNFIILKNLFQNFLPTINCANDLQSLTFCF